jgi:hypothetical protein
LLQEQSITTIIDVIITITTTLSADIVTIGMGEDVDPKELAMIVDNPKDLILGDFSALTQQIEMLVIQICSNTNHAPGEKVAMDSCPLQTNARNCTGVCAWCPAARTCAAQGMCPGARKTVRIDPATLPVCACTASGAKWSDVSQSHFCWLEESPCRGVGNEVLLNVWADCGAEVTCEANSRDVLHPYSPDGAIADKFDAAICYLAPGPRVCKAHKNGSSDGCSWCPPFRACAPKGGCATLSSMDIEPRGKRMQVTTDTETSIADAYDYVSTEPQDDMVVTADFHATLASVMLNTLGTERDPATGTSCLTTLDMCTVKGEEYCCNWQTNLVFFYTRLNEELGPSIDQRNGMRCTNVQKPCETRGQEYCCKWQTGLLALFKA